MATTLTTLYDLTRSQVVDPSHLDSTASVDKDDLLTNNLVELADLIDLGVIVAQDLTVTSVGLGDVQAAGLVDFDATGDLQNFIDLELITPPEIDGLGVVDKQALIDNNLTTENDLLAANLLGKHVNLVDLLATGVTTIDELQAEELDDRSGLVELSELVASPLVTLAQLELAGIVPATIQLDALLETGQVKLSDLVDRGIDKTILLGTTFSGSLTLTETDLIDAGLFVPLGRYRGFARVRTGIGPQPGGCRTGGCHDRLGRITAGQSINQPTNWLRRR